MGLAALNVDKTVSVDYFGSYRSDRSGPRWLEKKGRRSSLLSVSFRAVCYDNSLSFQETKLRQQKLNRLTLKWERERIMNYARGLLDENTNEKTI